MKEWEKRYNAMKDDEYPPPIPDYFVHALIGMVLEEQGYDERTDSIKCEGCGENIQEIHQNCEGKRLCFFCARKTYVKKRQWELRYKKQKTKELIKQCELVKYM